MGQAEPDPAAARSLILFAGGRATRLAGVNKALLDVGGDTIYERILRAAGPLAAEHLVLVNDPAAVGNNPATAGQPGLRFVLDPNPHAGVLPALANALEHARGEVCLAVACDMPFVSRPLFEHLLALQAAHDADVVIPRTAEFLEPMHAVYRRAPVARAIREALARGEQRMISYFPAVRVVEVPADDVKTLDPLGRAFFNVNTPSDLAEAQRLAALDRDQHGTA